MATAAQNPKVDNEQTGRRNPTHNHSDILPLVSIPDNPNKPRNARGRFFFEGNRKRRGAAWCLPAKIFTAVFFFLPCRKRGGVDSAPANQVKDQNEGLIKAIKIEYNFRTKTIKSLRHFLCTLSGVHCNATPHATRTFVSRDPWLRILARISNAKSHPAAADPSKILNASQRVSIISNQIITSSITKICITFFPLGEEYVDCFLKNCAHCWALLQTFGVTKNRFLCFGGIMCRLLAGFG